MKYFILLTGQTLNTHDIFMSRLKHEIPQLQQVSAVDECDVILVFCPVVSQARTDIEAALKKLNQESANLPAVLVVLHRTFNPECVVPNSSRIIHRGNTITVDCLFYEDQGLLRCQKNQESFTRIINYIKTKRNAEMYEHMDAQEAGGPSQSSDKQENVLLQTEPSKTTLESMKKELQEKDRKLVEMEKELKKLKAELTELKMNETPTNETERQHIDLQVVGRDRYPSVRMQAQKTVSGVKAELGNIIQILLEKKDDLESVNKLLSEGI